MDVGTYSIPCVADWNGDGLPDLIVGYQPAWKIAVYTNHGTLGQPAFDGFGNMQADGADLVYSPAYSCGSPAPWVCDYDQDGKRDLLVGDGASGRIWFYKNVGTDASPVLAAGVQLLLNGSPLSVGARATPYVCDWDGDGLKDLFSGDANGYVHWFKNVGTAQAPVYTSDVRLQTVQAGSTNDLVLGLRSVVRVCDWDGDGRMDLVGAGNSYAGWCRNLSTTATPVLAAPVALQTPAPAGSLANLNTGSRMRLDVADWNHDGVPDVLIGDSTGGVFYYEGYHFAWRETTCPQAGVTVLKWNSAPYLRYKVAGGSTVTNLTTTLAPNVLSAGTVTCWTNSSPDRTGFFRVGILP